MKKILVLGAPLFQVPLIKCAKEMGLYVCVIDNNPKAEGIKNADEFYHCSLKDWEQILVFASSFNPDGVTVGMCDVAVYSAAVVCEVLGLSGLSREVAERATNKHLMIQTFEEHNVPHPHFFRLKKEELEFAAVKKSICYPVICKPIDMAGSRGINIAYNDADLLKAMISSSEAGDCGEILVEEYMIGPEVSVEILVINKEPYVLQVTDKITSGAPHFVELGHVQPSSLPKSVISRIEAIACDAARALGITNSFAHAEIIITDNGPKMVEIGARMGGDGIQQQLIALSTGMNLPEISIKLALGEKVLVPTQTINKYSAIRFIPSKPGVVESLEIPDDLMESECTKEVCLTCDIGSIGREAVDSSGRFGFVLSQADSAKEALENCEQVINRIVIEMS